MTNSKSPRKTSGEAIAGSPIGRTRSGKSPEAPKQRNPRDQLPFDFEHLHAIVAGRLFWYTAQEMQNGEISFTQQNALYSLFIAKSLSVGNLAKELNLSQTATSHMLERLFAKALITRAEDPGDRRRKIIALTDAGRERILAMKRFTINSYVELLEPLPNELKLSLADNLRKLVSHLPSPTLPDVDLR